MSELSNAILEMRVAALLAMLRREGIYHSAETVQLSAIRLSNMEVMREFRRMRRQGPWWASIFRPRAREIIRELESGAAINLARPWLPKEPIQ